MIFADEHLLVVNKPSGLLSVPGRFMKDCVLHRMQFEYPDARNVHRLDLDTSGLLVLALSQLAVSDINRQFRERIVGKSYVACVYGDVIDAEGEIDLPLAPDPVNRPRQLVDHEQGKASLTRFERLRVENGCSRLLLRPVTGRSHQLRVHLAAIGHPILGCDLYAHEAAFKASDRLCLHASELNIDHPATAERLTFSCPVPF